MLRAKKPEGFTMTSIQPKLTNVGLKVGYDVGSSVGLSVGFSVSIKQVIDTVCVPLDDIFWISCREGTSSNSTNIGNSREPISPIPSWCR